MVDRYVQALAEVVSIAGARRTRAEQTHSRALRAETAANEAARAADAAVIEAADEWTRQMSAGFDPLFARRLGSELVEAASAATTAKHEAITAREGREAAAFAWREEDARHRGAQQAFGDHAHRLSRRREEAQLAAVSDRVAQRWGRS